MIHIDHPTRFITFLTIIFLTVLLGAFMLWRLFWGAATLEHSGQLIIEEGSGAATVWEQLVAGGFTARTTPWRFYAWRFDAATNIKPGTYQLTAGEHVREVIQRLVTGDQPNHVTITYPEGFTLEQIAARTTANSIGTAEEFLRNATVTSYIDQFSFLADLPPGRNLEGYLFPDTYQFFLDAAPADVTQRLLANFARQLTPELRQAITDQGRTIDEVVIMASIIEREVQTDDDMAQVSGVLWQRFDDNVGLGADATVRYALDKWDDPLTVQDLEVDSPYNTRKFRGLPPGPISNPGLRALTAAANPQESEYYYYLSAPTGQTIFSQTLDEHNANKARYLR